MDKSLPGARPKVYAYLGIIFAVVVWGTVPVMASWLYNYYSAAVFTAATSLIAGLALVLICVKKLSLINKSFLKIAVTAGAFNALASLFQKIGLQYTTPAKYAFLQNLSCVVVPFVLFVIIRKKPGVMTLIAAFSCLFGIFMLTGMGIGGRINAGDLLCAIAGCFYGVNIAVTGVYAKKLDTLLYVAVQTWMQFVVSAIAALIFSLACVGGEAIEPFRFTFKLWPLFALIVVGLVSNMLCWIIRTNAAKRVNPDTVAVIMPFTAVVTAVISVSVGADRITAGLIIGAIFCVLSALLSSVDDIRNGGKKEERQENDF